MTPREIEERLTDCENVMGIPKSAGGPGYSKWALDFLSSAREQFDNRGTLTEKQCEKLDELWHQID